MSKTPASVFASGRRSPVSEVMLREALIVRGKRQLRRDTTLWIAGSEFETTQSFLAGRNVTVGRSLLDCSELPWFEHEDQGYVVTHVAPRTNVDLACVAVSMRLPSIRRAFCSRKPSARRPNGGSYEYSGYRTSALTASPFCKEVSVDEFWYRPRAKSSSRN